MGFTTGFVSRSISSIEKVISNMET
jgi:MICOS complex subunit MIC12